MKRFILTGAPRAGGTGEPWLDPRFDIPPAPAGQRAALADRYIRTFLGPE